MTIIENKIEQDLIDKLIDLKNTYRPNIRDCGLLEEDFSRKFEALNSIKLTDTEFARLHDEIVTADVDVFTAAERFCEQCHFQREDGMLLHIHLSKY